jgi:hypothetical protein
VSYTCCQCGDDWTQHLDPPATLREQNLVRVLRSTIAYLRTNQEHGIPDGKYLREAADSFQKKVDALVGVALDVECRPLL